MGTPSKDFDFQLAGCYLVTTGNIGADAVTIKRIRGMLSGGQGVIKAGTVLGKVTATGEYVAHDPALADGGEVAVAISYDTFDTSVDGNTDPIHAPIDTGDIKVNSQSLIWITGITNAQMLSGVDSLLDKGIVISQVEDTLTPVAQQIF